MFVEAIVKLEESANAIAIYGGCFLQRCIDKLHNFSSSRDVVAFCFTRVYTVFCTSEIKKHAPATGACIHVTHILT